MYCTVKEIIREVLNTDVPDSECVFAVLCHFRISGVSNDNSLPQVALENTKQDTL